MNEYVSPEVAANLDKFIGLTRIKSRLRKLEERTGMKKAPEVNGTTAEDKIDSLISALAVLGLIDDKTT